MKHKVPQVSNLCLENDVRKVLVEKKTLRDFFHQEAKTKANSLVTSLKPAYTVKEIFDKEIKLNLLQQDLQVRKLT